MARSESVEKAYETASTKKGSERARPKSAPPTGGPPTLIAAWRPVMTFIAAGSCSAGTTARRAPDDAAWKKDPPVPSRNAASGIIQKTSSPLTIAPARAAIVTSRMTSEAIISRLRLQRSARSPAGSAKTAAEARRANPTIPAFVAEPVRLRTRSG